MKDGQEKNGSNAGSDMGKPSLKYVPTAGMEEDVGGRC